ncbi:MAG: transposase family protein [Sphingomonadales bacterium]|nr:transposase family protein [Sphingomonadales bacterium]
MLPLENLPFFQKHFGGRVTDTFLTVNSGLLKLLEPGDVVLADKGFPQIEPDLNSSGAFLVMPPFKQSHRQFTSSENASGYKCSSLRIHVERAICRLKYFKILHFLSNDILPYVDRILIIIAFLCNNMPELIQNH